MSSADRASVDKKFLGNAMAAFLQIGAVLLLLSWCFVIVAPFISIIVWGLIIAVALYPFHQKLANGLGGRQKLSSMLLVLTGLTILLVPAWLLTESSVTALRTVAENVNDGNITITPPDPSVAEWPVIGESVFELWSGAASNLETTLNKFQPQLLSFGQWTLGFAGSTAIGILQFVFSIIIAGVFMTVSEKGYKAALAIASSLADTKGKELTDLSIQTIRSVTKGVLGVAIIQAILAAIGLVVMDIPAAGIWAGAVLMLAIMQLPPVIILGPIAFWVFSVAEPVPATLFAVYAFVVSISDSFLKPMFLGRGVDVPMLVILIGAIGGAISSGIVGLFIGAVVLAVGYQLLIAWMASDIEMEAEGAQTPAGSSD
jgi:predicted PurR-regulated permease PerM